MRSLKYSIPIALAVWWLPILNGVIVGLVTGFSERRRDVALISASVSSVLATAVYVFLAYKVLDVPLLGNLLPVFTVIFSLIGISLSVTISYLVSNRTTFSVITPEGADMEFYVKDNSEIEQRLSSLTAGCGEPSYNILDENNVTVTRKCNGYEIEYNVKKEGRMYKVNVHVKTHFE
ncbi:hypothetical protein GWK48_07540 [Metallosphaera tengchongensis]|uniref:Uncharacterized protein n=1 Tax=Metallosphaera tengchongensis TaxID=1532350 RepID=A0A6N0NVK7_9CREN|nr:hypothetical protein [Metallosphaera tengchongensis]QKR00247.1 hypothetical protein GWK48_07540 [Metallosphaera tengchongensis]